MNFGFKMLLTLISTIAMIILFVIAFSFAVKNAVGFETIEVPDTFLSAKPVECTFNKDMRKEHVETLGEKLLATAKTMMATGNGVIYVEVSLYANPHAKTLSIFELFSAGSICLTLQSDNLLMLPYGIVT